VDAPSCLAATAVGDDGADDCDSCDASRSIIVIGVPKCRKVVYNERKYC
jgi:hypothetical protein